MRTRAVALLTVSVLSVPFLFAAAVAEESIAGRWRVDAIRFGEEKLYFVELLPAGKKVSGTWISPRTGRYRFDGGSFENGALRFEVQRKGEELESRVYALELKAVDGRFEGEFKVNGEVAGRVVLTRFVNPALGKWNVVSKSPDGTQEYKAALEIKETDRGLAGSYAGQLGTFETGEMESNGEVLVFGLTLPIDGNDVNFRIRAEFEGKDALIGRWFLSEDVSGEWNARRAAPSKADSPPASPADPAVLAALTAKWYGVAAAPDGEKREFQLVLNKAGDSLAGKLHYSDGVVDIEGARLDGRRLQFTIKVKTDDGEKQVKMEAALGDDGVLRGKFTAPDGESGEFSARKPVKL